MKIEDIASVHLGKAGDGSVVKPYVTPTIVTPSLLVPIPRSLNRLQYDLSDANLPFVGYDVWNAYEFSTLLDNGYPLSGVLRIAYPASSPNIVESKSLKLYLNSYNMFKAGKTATEAANFVEMMVKFDLCNILGPNVSVKLHTYEVFVEPPLSVPGYAGDLDNYYYEGEQFTDYSENPDLLEVTPYVDDKTAPEYVYSHSLRSNCRVTNQPDWGDVHIFYRAKQFIPRALILKYIVSMRNENHFHEEVTECIYTRLWQKLQPEELLVACLYTRRGGIDINPVRASSPDVLEKFAGNLINTSILNRKTMRQ